MRLLIGIISFLILGLSTQAQTIKPIRWVFSLSKSEVKQGDVVEIIMKAEVNNDWYLYSSDFNPDLGPTVSSISFTQNSSFKAIGKLIAIGAKEKYDSLWEGKIKYFTKTGEFRQKVKILAVNPVIKAMLSYQVCSDKEGKCIPYDEQLSFTTLKVIASALPPEKQSVIDSPKTTMETTTVEKPTPTKNDLADLEKEKAKLIQKDSKGNDLAVDQLKKFSQKYGGEK